MDTISGATGVPRPAAIRSARACRPPAARAEDSPTSVAFPASKDYRLEPDEYAAHVYRIKRSVTIPIVGSVERAHASKPCSRVAPPFKWCQRCCGMDLPMSAPCVGAATAAGITEHGQRRGGARRAQSEEYWGRRVARARALHPHAAQLDGALAGSERNNGLNRRYRRCPGRPCRACRTPVRTRSQNFSRNLRFSSASVGCAGGRARR